ncbi:IclR family transcriptional regulator [Coraliomargarita parva]|uniref:IclR family transcriptional regulator n=1 Tax=Coraliomargarita parva TaxID=3014050 RepID=UPI0022B34B8D|nr:helix-turn-helix domain-containing protein [Coraliomargarita parva]
MPSSPTNPAVSKAIAIVQFIAERTSPVTVKELSYALEVPPASCYRMVRSMLEQNWLRQDPAGGLRIAFGLAHVARSYSEIEHALGLIQVPLQKLAQELNLSAKVTLREGHYAVTALRADPDAPNAITSQVGYRFHLTIGSAAGVLLSTLDDTRVKQVIHSAPAEVWGRQTVEDVWKRIEECRKDSICRDFGVQHPSIYALSVPINLTSDTIASVTVVGWPEQFEDDVPEITERLRQAAVTMRTCLDAES